MFSKCSHIELTADEIHDLRKGVQKELDFSDSEVDYDTDDVELTDEEMEAGDNEYYAVEKILDRKLVHGWFRYKVKWRGYSLNETTWEPTNHFICRGSRLAVYRYHERELLKKKLRESEGIKDEKENHVSSKTFLNNHKSADNYCDQKQSKIPVKSLSRHRSNVQKFKEIQNSIEKLHRHSKNRDSSRFHNGAASVSSKNYERSQTFQGGIKKRFNGKLSEEEAKRFLSMKAKLDAFKNVTELHRKAAENIRQEAEMEAKLRMKRENDRRRQERERQEKERALLKAQKLAERERREAEEHRRKAEAERRRLQFIKDLCESDSEDE